MTAIARLRGALPGPAAPRALWLRQELERDTTRRPPLEALERADICIVGGGYTGLWTAWHLKRRDPGVDVAVVEGDICGGGASGRNGGFVMSWWSKFGSLAKLCGREDALRLAAASEDAVQAIGDLCRRHDIDAGFHRGGWLWTATSPAQCDAWRATLAAVGAAGATPFQQLAPDEVARRGASPVHLGGVFEPGVAIVQPAALARGLARVVEAQGVRLYEHSAVRAVYADPLRVVTTQGELLADRVVLAANAWNAAALPSVGRSVAVVASEVIATTPLAEDMAASLWDPHLAISDSRRLVQYFRRSGDGRIVFGKGGGRLAFAGRVTPAFHGAAGREPEMVAALRRLYPQLGAIEAACSWSGPIDYSSSGLPFFCRHERDPRVLAGTGFSGNGVGPSYIGGDVLASMALDGPRDEWPAALTTPPARLPPEPLRSIGGRVVREGIARKEAAEDEGRRARRAVRAVAALDPTSFVDRG